ncbi:DUF6241 domain-containing protein [Bacillus sp. FJAT-29814]|uniref:DUF6241 domain-containing protein n=1 Tax=Bacillus sp. FJAT-29814 TaxID=1729688 RepID=UPI0008376763|nr:DUF6241 domain-containing protein [Bacillus sp. FJAT-29814]
MTGKKRKRIKIGDVYVIPPMPLTDATVNRLINLIKHNHYIFAKEFLVILYCYQKHDYSHAVQDHNDMWNLQGGNEGEATSLATPHEEQANIDRNVIVK